MTQTKTPKEEEKYIWEGREITKEEYLKIIGDFVTAVYPFLIFKKSKEILERSLE